MCRAALVLVSLLVAACPGQGPRVEETGVGLDWLAGCWQSDDGRARETWVYESDGSLIGFGILLVDGRLASHELLSIRNDGGGKRTYTAHPSGQARTSFVEREAGDDYIRFANHGHDYPQLIAYRRDGARLLATIARLDGGNEQRFAWRRCD